MKIRYYAILNISLAVILLTGCATPQESQDVRRGAGVGAAAGAVLGLAMGAATEDRQLAIAGAVAGATAGAASGGMYMYDQSRQDRRTQTLAESIGGAKQGETSDEAGKRHLADFTGNWNLDIWSMNAAGKKVTANGKATAVLPAKDTLRIEYQDIRTAAYDGVITGTTLITYSANSGFTLENRFPESSDATRWVGEYIPAKNAYNLYPAQDMDGKTITGVIASNLRIELRISGTNLVVAETYTMIDGKEVQIQSYRFTRQ
jgi:hypothetical protein